MTHMFWNRSGIPAFAFAYFVDLGMLHCRSWEIALLRAPVLEFPLDAAMGQRHMTEART